MSTWEKVVLRHIIQNYQVGDSFYRQTIIENHLPYILGDLGHLDASTRKTPDQTLSATLQTLRNKGFLRFHALDDGRPGVYSLLRLPDADYWNDFYRYHGEAMVARILEELHAENCHRGYQIIFLSQRTFDLRNDGNYCRPDFYVELCRPNGSVDSFIIEFDGKQHWDLEYARKLFRASHDADQKFADLQRRDKIKDREFPRRDMRLLRIWKLNFEENKKLIRDFLFGDTMTCFRQMFNQ